MRLQQSIRLLFDKSDREKDDAREVQSLKKINDVVDRMYKVYGYMPESANEFLRYMGTALNW